MNDQRLEDLVRMAVEADEFERSIAGLGAEPGTDAAPVPFPRGRAAAGAWKIGRFAAITAAAAGLAVAAVGAWQLWRQVGTARSNLLALESRTPAATEPAISVTSVPPPAPDPSSTRLPEVSPVGAVRITSAVHKIAQPVPAHEPDCGMVVVIVHDLRGFSRCVQVRSEDWRGRCPTDLSHWELTAPNVARACMSGSKQMLVLALSGPAARLPTSERGAEELAACILGMPRGCDAEGSCYAGAAATCLPQDVNFKVETVAVR